MVVFGIDPGYAIVGWGAISFKSNTYKAIGYGSVETEAHTDFNERLEYIYDELHSILSRCRPDALAIERLYFQTNQKTAIKVAQARGVTLLAAQKLRIPIFEYTPLQVKDTCCSADTRIEDIRFSNIEFDLDGLPLKCKFQKTDDMRYPGDSTVAELTVAYVGCQHPREDHGNQKFVEVADPSGYRSLIHSVVFENFTFPGFTPPLVAELFTTVPGQEVRDIEFRSVPPVNVRRRGNIGSVKANGKEVK